MKIYIAGKVSKDSSFGIHNWRDKFCDDLSRHSGIVLEHLDPLCEEKEINDPWKVFSEDCKMIKACELLVVYLSDDISVGGSQEILIAKYFGKPVIGYAPYKGKFNNATREMFGKKLTNYKDPFVFSTCDIVCGTFDEVAEAIRKHEELDFRSLSLDMIINKAIGDSKT